METYSTVLFVDHAPVGYKVQRSAERIELNPAENPSRQVQPPQLVAENRGEEWVVTGTENPELIEQVLSELVGRGTDNAHLLSAAP